MDQGAASAIIWVMGGRKSDGIWLLKADKEPSERIISGFREHLEGIVWPGYDNEIDTDDEA